MASAPARTEFATFGAGCFWHVEEAFRKIPGVVNTTVGYMGGMTPHPTYEDVSSGDTGDAEVVQVEYDPAVVSYAQLLKTFWESHDPTEVDRQGPDVGSQYRSVIFTHTPEQAALAEASKKALGDSGAHAEPVATAIKPATAFTRAEEEHQRYLAKHGLSTCPV